MQLDDSLSHFYNIFLRSNPFDMLFHPGRQFNAHTREKSFDHATTTQMPKNDAEKQVLRQR